MSPLYLARFVRRFPISLLAFERLHELISAKFPVEEAVLSVLRECCSRPQPSDEDIRYFLDRADAVSRETAKAEESPSQTPVRGKSRSFCSGYRDFMSKLETFELLALACQFDMRRAEYLFCEVDRDDAVALMKLYAAQATEERMVQLEAVVYGMGGGFSGSSAGDDAEKTDLKDADFDTLKRAFETAH